MNDLEARIEILTDVIAMVDDPEVGIECSFAQRAYFAGLLHGLKVAAGQEALTI